MPSRYTVVPGDCISSIAFTNGFFPDTIWQWPDNEDLRNLRASLNVLDPGDIVFIPDKRPKSQDAATDQAYRFRLKGVPEKLRFRLVYGGQPIANEAYTLEIDGKPVGNGQTDGNGEVALPILPNARLAKVTVRGQVFQLKLGHLDAIDEMNGVQMRLQNLGYYAGPIDGVLNPDTEEALVAYQFDKNLDLSGEADDATKAALVQDAGA